MKLLISTHNSGKMREMREVLDDLPLQILMPADVGLGDDDVEETGETHEENALLKARHFFARSGIATIGEDSGIYVDAFPGELGVQTRRWKGLHNATDEEWIAYFLEQLKDVPPEKRTARFVSCSAVVASFGEKVFVGETRGTITRKLEAPLIPGIPISSCFIPDGSDRVYAAMSPEEKNKVSHRGKAMHQTKQFLADHLLGENRPR